MTREDIVRPAFLVLWLALALAAYYLITELTMLIICLIAAITLSAAIAPFARKMQSRGVPRVATIIALYLCIMALYSAVGYNLGPMISQQASNLVKLVHEKVQPWALAKWHELIPDSTEGSAIDPDASVPQISGPSDQIKDSIKDAGNKVKNRIMESAGSLASGALKLTGNVMTFIVNILFVLFLTAYFVVESKTIIDGLLRWLPQDKRTRVRDLLPGLETRLGGYVRGQILVSLAVGSIIGLGLTIVGIPDSLVLGVVAGLLNLVPFVGSLTTAVFAIIIGFNQSLTTGLLVIVVFVIEQWLESNFIVPHLLGRQVDMHPLIVLFSVLIGGTLLGLSGALIAVPVTTVLLYLAEELYLKKLDENRSATLAESPQ